MIEKVQIRENNIVDPALLEDNLDVLANKLNEVISIVNKISSLKRLEKDLKELGEAFDEVE